MQHNSSFWGSNEDCLIQVLIKPDKSSLKLAIDFFTGAISLPVWHCLDSSLSPGFTYYNNKKKGLVFNTRMPNVPGPFFFFLLFNAISSKLFLFIIIFNIGNNEEETWLFFPNTFILFYQIYAFLEQVHVPHLAVTQ